MVSETLAEAQGRFLNPNWNTISNTINKLRIIPRLVLLSLALFTFWYVRATTYWYMELPHSERGLESSGLLAITIPAVTGLFVQYCKHYMAWKPEGSE